MGKQKHEASISIVALRRIIIRGDVEALTEVFDNFGISGDKKELPLVSADFRLIKFLLEHASVQAAAVNRNSAEAEADRYNRMFEIIVERIAKHVELFDFLQLFLSWCVDSYKFDKSRFEKSLIDALYSGRYKKGVSQQIANLEEGEFVRLCGFIMAKIDTLDRDYSIPILRYIFVHRLLPHEILFAYMRIFLEDALPSRIGGVQIIRIEEVIRDLKDEDIPDAPTD